MQIKTLMTDLETIRWSYATNRIPIYFDGSTLTKPILPEPWGYVYYLYEKDVEETYYIGSTRKPVRRYNQHINTKWRGSHNPALYRWIRDVKSRSGTVLMEIFPYKCKDEQELRLWEYWRIIGAYNRGDDILNLHIPSPNVLVKAGWALPDF